MLQFTWDLFITGDLKGKITPDRRLCWKQPGPSLRYLHPGKKNRR